MSRPLNTMQSGLAGIACEDIVLSALAAKGGRRSPTQLFGDIKSVMDRDDAQAAFQALKDNGSATDGSGKAALTA
jgi:hypothetical protein